MFEANASSSTAVVVEDDPDVRHLVTEVLQSAGFAVVAVDNGLDGVAAVKEHRPILATLDITMPGIDGFETARRMRAVSDVHIIMLSALSGDADIALGLKSGANDYLTKPFRPRQLRARVDALLGRA